MEIIQCHNTIFFFKQNDEIKEFEKTAIKHTKQGY